MTLHNYGLALLSVTSLLTSDQIIIDREALALRKDVEQAERQTPSGLANPESMNRHLALIQNQYRMFDELVPFLRRPAYFTCQHIYFPFSQSLKALLIERFAALFLSTCYM